MHSGAVGDVCWQFYATWENDNPKDRGTTAQVSTFTGGGDEYPPCQH
jgi:hypothetical protein